MANIPSNVWDNIYTTALNWCFAIGNPGITSLGHAPFGQRKSGYLSKRLDPVSGAMSGNNE